MLDTVNCISPARLLILHNKQPHVLTGLKQLSFSNLRYMSAVGWQGGGSAHDSHSGVQVMEQPPSWTLLVTCRGQKSSKGFMAALKDSV